jgi:hypothetical protein
VDVTLLARAAIGVVLAIIWGVVLIPWLARRVSGFANWALFSLLIWVTDYFACLIAAGLGYGEPRRLEWGYVALMLGFSAVCGWLLRGRLIPLSTLSSNQGKSPDATR